jgi:hypothetical protein
MANVPEVDIFENIDDDGNLIVVNPGGGNFGNNPQTDREIAAANLVELKAAVVEPQKLESFRNTISCNGVTFQNMK